MTLSLLSQEKVVLGESDKAVIHAWMDSDRADSLVSYRVSSLSECANAQVYYDSEMKKLAYESYIEADSCHSFHYGRNGKLQQHSISILDVGGLPLWWWSEEYCSNGQLITKGPSPNQKDTTMVVYYYCNGTKWFESLECGGEIIGDVNFWYENGQLKHSMTYINNRLHGEWKNWDEDGNWTYSEFYDRGKYIETKKNNANNE